MQAVSGLLAALESEQLGIDVAIVVGRPFLDDSDASILASEVGAVLWAFDPQETSREDAEEAARRLELARADAVGIVLATGHA
jgi:Mrp family chromosome partitioning ATPase